MNDYDMTNIISAYFHAGSVARENTLLFNMDNIIKVSRLITNTFNEGGKLLLCGNGGSAADSQHIAAEFVGRFELERTPLPVIALTTDTSILTAVGNDYGFNDIFARQVKAHGCDGDILIAISTSGSSSNVIRAIKTAKDNMLTVIGLTGKDGGEIAQLSDVFINVNSYETAIIQEVHITISHVICRLVEKMIFD